MTQELLRRIAKEKDEKTGKLDLSNLKIGESKKLTEIFEKINDLTHLNELNLNSNKLNQIPKIDKLEELLFLFLDNNNISTLPDDFL